MDRYRKAWIAVAGAGLQALALAATAAGSGLLPESWRPWASVVIALATALGVYGIPNTRPPLEPLEMLGHDGRHEAGRGAATVAVLALTATMLLAAPAAVAAARRYPAARPGPLYVGILAAHQCTGLLDLGYGTERLTSGTWGIVPDSWGADVQLHFIGNGARTGGQWETVPGIHRTEGHVAAEVSGLPTWDLVRVAVRADGTVVASSGRIPEGCAE
jgi:hypothetical protein